MTREIKYIEKSEIEKLISVIDNLRDRLLIKLMYATMCRSNEIRNIKISDVKFDSN